MTFMYSAAMYLGVSEEVARSSMWEFKSWPARSKTRTTATAYSALGFRSNVRRRCTRHGSSQSPSRVPLSLSRPLGESQHVKIAFGHDCFRVLNSRNVGTLTWS
jgi:hypothetical protein